jgi:hypothetical protein
MTPESLIIGPKDRARYTDCLIKAEEFLRSALEDAARRRWNATGLSAVHAGISAAYSVLDFECGLASPAQGCEDFVELLAGPGADRSSALVHLRRVLAGKSLIEYERQLFSRREARELLQHAERFLAWARTRVRPAAP